MSRRTAWASLCAAIMSASSGSCRRLGSCAKRQKIRYSKPNRFGSLCKITLSHNAMNSAGTLTAGAVAVAAPNASELAAVSRPCCSQNKSLTGALAMCHDTRSGRACRASKLRAARRKPSRSVGPRSMTGSIVGANSSLVKGSVVMPMLNPDQGFSMQALMMQPGEQAGVQPLQNLAKQATQAEAVVGPAQVLMAQPVKAWLSALAIQAMHHQTSRPARALVSVARPDALNRAGCRGDGQAAAQKAELF